MARPPADAYLLSLPLVVHLCSDTVAWQVPAYRATMISILDLIKLKKKGGGGNVGPD